MNSKGFRFFCPSYTPMIVEARNAKFLEDLEFSGSDIPRKVQFEEIKEPSSSFQDNQLIIVQNDHSVNLEDQLTQDEQIPNQLHHEDSTNNDTVVQNQDIMDETVELRRSSRVRKPAISNDYMVYLQDTDFDGQLNAYPTSFFTSHDWRKIYPSV